jgi:hypothetical protein
MHAVKTRSHPISCIDIYSLLRDSNHLIATEGALIRVPWRRLAVDAAGVFCVLVYRTAALVVGKEFFDFPVVLLGTNREFEIFFSDWVPILIFMLVRMNDAFEGKIESTNLVDHHDCQKIANSCKEKAVKVVLYDIADSVGKDVEDNLSNDEEECAKSNISKGPAILQGPRHKNDLHDNID